VWLALGVVALGSYLPRVCRTLCLFGDSAELGTAAAVWGVPHAPGYPLLTLVAHLFTRIPWGEVAFRTHVTSAVFHAATVAVVGATLHRLTGSILGAVSGAALLGLARSFLLASLYYEAFPLNDLWFAVCLGLALGPGRRRVVTLALCLGLAIAHHQMMLLGLPAIGVLLWPELKQRPRLLAVGALVILATFCLSYAVLLIRASRSPAVSWGDVHDLGSLMHLILRADYGGVWSASSRPSPWLPVERGFALLGTLGRSLGPAALLAALLAWCPLARSHPRVAVALALAWVLPGPFFFVINRVGLDREEQLAFVERFSTMCHIPLALLFGWGIAWVQERLAPLRARWAAGVLALGLGAPVVWGARAVDLSGDQLGRSYLHDLVMRVPDGSLVLLSGDMPVTAAQYACVVERTCGHRAFLAPGRLFAWQVRQLRQAQPELGLPDLPGLSVRHSHLIAREAIQQRAVYVHPVLLRKDPELGRQFVLVPDLLLVRLLAGGEPDRAAALERARAIAFGHVCAGCQAPPAGLPRPTLHAQLFAEYHAALSNQAELNASLGGPSEVTRRLSELALEQVLTPWSDPALPAKVQP
jgi:hypothetical protein